MSEEVLLSSREKQAPPFERTVASLAEADLEPGGRYHLRLRAAETVTGPIDLPLTVLCGAREGPTVAVTAACHPGEYNGIMTAIRLGSEIQPEQLSGRVVIVHVLNAPAVQAKVGHISPIDSVNMGRAFPVPGRTVETEGGVSHQAKSPTYTIAESVFREVILPSDAYIDLHGGEFFEYVPPNIEYLLGPDEQVNDATRKLAASFGFRLLWEVPTGSIPEMPTYPGRGSAVYEAQLQGIPGVYCEVGGEGRLDPELVQLTFDGVLRALGSMEMLPDTDLPSGEASLTLIGGHVVFAARAGMFISTARPAEQVTEGQELGRIIDLSGAVVEQLTSPGNAIIVNVVTRGIANAGDMLFVLASLPPND
jgi:predicted deacylase